MTGIIRIDPPELGALANKLGNVAPSLSTEYPPGVSACQSWGVTDVLAQFVLELEHQRRDLQESIQSLAKGVVKTADDFSEYDAALTVEFNQTLPELK